MVITGRRGHRPASPSCQDAFRGLGFVHSLADYFQAVQWMQSFQWIGLGENFNRKTPQLMVKTHGFPVNFPLNQSIDPWAEFLGACV